MRTKSTTETKILSQCPSCKLCKVIHFIGDVKKKEFLQHSIVMFNDNIPKIKCYGCKIKT